MIRVRLPTAERPTAAVERKSAHPVLRLQRTVGNRAVAQLLQRQGADIRAEFAKIAALEKADLDSLGISAASINETRRAKVGDAGLQPGLNLADAPGGRGETGFVDGDAKHVYRGSYLPVSLTGPLPQVAIILSPSAFDAGEVGARTTLRHELTHAKHAQMLIGWLVRWREAVKKAGGTGPAFAAWAAKQTMSDVERELLADTLATHRWNTEVLAHVEGFILAFTLDSSPPTAAAIAKGRMPPAIEEIRGLGDTGWALADAAVKRVALDRVRDFYSSLTPTAQASLREWLFFLLDRSVPKAPPPVSKDVEVQAARIVHSQFHPLVGLLEALLEVVRKVGFARHAPPAPSAQTPVKDIRPSKAKPTTAKVGKGTVTAMTDVAYRADQPRLHGMSLRYEGPDSGSAHWLQFIWWEIVPNRGPPVAGEMTHGSSTYRLTTDPANPGWNTDTGTYIAGVAGAFFEKDTSANRDANSIQIFDQPDPREKYVQDAFARTPKPSHVKAVAHLTDYLVIGPDVVFRSEVEFGWDYTAPDEHPDARPQIKSAGPAHALDPGPRARVAQQFPELDYLR